MKIRWTIAAALVLLTACGSKDSNATVASTVSSTSTTSTVPLEEQPFPVNETDGEVVYDEEITPLDRATTQLVSKFPKEPHPLRKEGCAGVTSRGIIEGFYGYISPDDEIPWVCSGGWIKVNEFSCDECDVVMMLRLSASKLDWVANCDLRKFDCWTSPAPPIGDKCALWSAYRELAALTRTGCNASKGDIMEVVNRECWWWSEDSWPSTDYPEGNCIYGWRIKRIQEILSDLGYDINTDGYFGVKSARAILLYQKDHNLKLTASLDDKTYEAMTTS